MLLGGADETDEPNRVFSYMNLARAFAELEAGAELYCLHKNRWWQTSRGPLLDSGAFVAGLEYAAGVEATVLGKPSPAFFGVALEALDAEPELTWMVGDDLEADVARGEELRPRRRSSSARASSARARSTTPLVKPDAVVDSLGDVPGLASRGRCEGRRRPDRDRAHRAGARALLGLRARAASRRPSASTATAGRIRRSTTRRASPARRPSGRRSAAASASPGGRSRSPAGRSRGVSLSGRTKAWAEKVSAGAIDLSMSHSKELATAVCLVADRDASSRSTRPPRCARPRSATRAAVEELMERAGRAVAEHALEDFGNARSFTVVCGSGSNGGDGKVAARVLEEAGRDVLVVDAKPEDEEKDLGDPDVLVDALFGTGFEGEPRPGAARLIEQMNGLGAPILAVDLPSGVDASTGEVAGAAVDADLTVDLPRREGRALRRRRAPTSPGYLEVVDIGLERCRDRARARDAGDPRPRAAAQPGRQQVQVRARRGRRWLAGHDRARLASPPRRRFARTPATWRSQAPSRRCPSSRRWVLEAVKRGLPADGAGLVTEAAAEPALELVAKAGSLAVGPGLGRSQGTKACVRRLLGRGAAADRRRR